MQKEGEDNNFRTKNKSGKELIFNYETVVDIKDYTRILNFDPKKNQYYFAIAESWDFADNRGKDEKEKSDNILQEILSGSWDPENQLSDIVNAAGKPIPLYDRYYLSNDEMKGILTYYQLDFDGNKTTAIDDIISSQLDEEGDWFDYEKTGVQRPPFQSQKNEIYKKHLENNLKMSPLLQDLFNVQELLEEK